jgi:hypothetical protein
MDRLLDVLAGLGLLLLLIVLRALRREHIRVEHSVSWLAACAALLVLSRSQAALDKLSKLLGMREPAVSLVFLILIVFLGVFYRFSRVVSELKDMNITLTQKVAMMDYELRARHEEEGKKS